MAFENIDHKKLQLYYVNSDNGQIPYALQTVDGGLIIHIDKYGNYELNVSGEHIASGYGVSTINEYENITYLANTYVLTYENTWAYISSSYSCIIDFINKCIENTYNDLVDYIDTSYNKVYNYAKNAYTTLDNQYTQQYTYITDWNEKSYLSLYSDIVFSYDTLNNNIIDSYTNLYLYAHNSYTYDLNYIKRSYISLSSYAQASYAYTLDYIDKSKQELIGYANNVAESAYYNATALSKSYTNQEITKLHNKSYKYTDDKVSSSYNDLYSYVETSYTYLNNRINYTYENASKINDVKLLDAESGKTIVDHDKIAVIPFDFSQDENNGRIVMQFPGNDERYGLYTGDEGDVKFVKLFKPSEPDLIKRDSDNHHFKSTYTNYAYSYVCINNYRPEDKKTYMYRFDDEPEISYKKYNGEFKIFGYNSNSSKYEVIDNLYYNSSDIYAYTLLNGETSDTKKLTIQVPCQLRTPKFTNRNDDETAYGVKYTVKISYIVEPIGSETIYEPTQTKYCSYQINGDNNWYIANSNECSFELSHDGIYSYWYNYNNDNISLLTKSYCWDSNREITSYWKQSDYITIPENYVKPELCSYIINNTLEKRKCLFNVLHAPKIELIAESNHDPYGNEETIYIKSGINFSLGVNDRDDINKGYIELDQDTNEIKHLGSFNYRTIYRTITSNIPLLETISYCCYKTGWNISVPTTYTVSLGNHGVYYGYISTNTYNHLIDSNNPNIINDLNEIISDFSSKNQRLKAKVDLQAEKRTEKFTDYFDYKDLNGKTQTTAQKMKITSDTSDARPIMLFYSCLCEDNSKIKVYEFQNGVYNVRKDWKYYDYKYEDTSISYGTLIGPQAKQQGFEYVVSYIY